MSLPRAIALSAFTLLTAVCLQAQASRTWVSGVGDDANPCSRTAPCKTFAGAISKTATNGEINCIDPGGFGAVVITKVDNDRLHRHIWQYPRLADQRNQHQFRGRPTRGTPSGYRGLAIDGTANGLNGIRVISEKADVTIENVVIDGFTQSGLSVESGASVVLSNVSIRGSVTGISVTGKGTVRLTRSLITANEIGVAAKSGLVLSYTANLIEGNGKNGNFSPAP